MSCSCADIQITVTYIKLIYNCKNIPEQHNLIRFQKAGLRNACAIRTVKSNYFTED